VGELEEVEAGSRAGFGVRHRRTERKGRDAYLMIEFTRDWELDYKSCGCVDVAVVSNFGLVGRHVVARWVGSFCRWLI
jgi:hypothetical protein